MANTAILAIRIVADAKGAQKGMEQASASTSKWASGMSTASKAATVGLAGIGAVLASSVKAAADDAQGQALLATAMTNTTGATKDQISAMEDYISKTTLATGVTDDELRPALASLLGATKDQAQAQALLKTAMDVSAATGKPLGQVSLAIAKAYNGNVAALGKLGVKVTDNTKDAKALAAAQAKVEKSQTKYNEAVKEHGPASKQAATAHEQLLASQEKLNTAQAKTKKTTVSFTEAIKRMNAQFGGAQAAKADTAAGKMQRFKVAVQETKESMGAVLLPVLTKLAGALATLAGAASAHPKMFLAIAGALAAIAAAVWLVNAALKVYKATMLVIQAVQAATFLTNPVFLIIAAIVLLVAAIVLLWKRSETFRKIVKGAFAAVLGAAKATWNWLKSNWPKLVAVLFGPFGVAVLLIVKNWGKIKDAAAATWSAIKTATAATAHFFVAVWNTAFAAVKTALHALVVAWNATFAAVKAAVNAVVGFFKAAWNAAFAVVTGYFNIWKTIVLGVFNAISTAISTVAGWFTTGFNNAVGNLKAIFNGLAAILMAPFDAMRGAVYGAIGAVQDLIDKVKGLRFLFGVAGFLPVFNSSSARASSVRASSAPAMSPAARGVGARSTSGGGVVYNFTINGAVDPEAVARQIKRIVAGHNRRMGGGGLAAV